MGVSVGAYNLLQSNGYKISTVYDGTNASQILSIVSENPVSGDTPEYYEKKPLSDLNQWLDDYKLPRSIATKAKNGISAYYYADINSNVWAVFAEDVSDNSRSIEQKFLLGNKVSPKEGYLQERALAE